MEVKKLNLKNLQNIKIIEKINEKYFNKNEKKIKIKN